MLLALAMLLAVPAAPGRPPAGGGPVVRPDRVALLLAEPDYEASRGDLRRELEARGGRACRSLVAYAASPSETVRENAVRALDDSGCRDYAHYRPFMEDRGAWVIELVLRAVRRHFVTEAVPFLLNRLSDPRNIVSQEGSWTLGESARKALWAVTCRSFPFDPRDTVERRAAALALWRRWYEQHRDEPRPAWVAAGLAQAKEDLDAGTSQERREAFDLLGLIGEPAVPVLQAALDRLPREVRATATCTPDEPPRVTDQVPCVLMVENLAARRVALALGTPVVSVTRRDYEPPAKTPARSRSGESPAGRKNSGESSPATARVATPAPTLEELTSRIVDLLPGQILTREFKVGPVPSSGHYDVRVTLLDLSSGLPRRDPSRDLPATMTLEAAVEVRFEQ
jgi:hypothetical protein